MPPTVLAEKLASAGARIGSYVGADTALHFSDPRSEFAALVSGSAIYDLGGRAKFKVAGRDRVRWLNNMVSNNIRDLPVGRGLYNFVLSPQGRILADLYAYNRGEYFVLDTDATQAAKIFPHLKRFIIMDQVEFTDISGELTAIGLQGPTSDDTLRTAGLDVPALESLQSVEPGWQFPVSIVRTDHPSSLGYELWTAPENVGSLWDTLIKAGASPVGAEATELHRIATGIPRYGQDIRERDLPQETAQKRALNFTKGCYIGQEIVERIRSRGNVHRTFTAFQIEGPLPPPGSKIEDKGKEVGEVTSAAIIPAIGRDGAGNTESSTSDSRKNESPKNELAIALGYIRREAVESGQSLEAKTFEVGEAKARIYNLALETVLR
jgi:folate-binding protein YgfZ